MLERLLLHEPATVQPLTDTPAESQFVVSDERTRQILTRIGAILHGEIAQASTFFMHGGGYDHLKTLPMEELELEGWRSIYGLDEVMERAITGKRLFTVDIDTASKELPQGIEEGTLVSPRDYSHLYTGYKQFSPPGTVRVNYGNSRDHGKNIHWVPRELVKAVDSTDDLTYHLRPQIHFGGQSYEAGALYNAFVSVDAYAQAANGVQLVSNVYGTGPSLSEPVFNPDVVLATSMWMNTKVEIDKPNSLEIRDTAMERVMLGAALHHIESLPELEIPGDDKVKMWFWQLDRLMRNNSLALPPAPSTPADHIELV